MYVAMCHCAVFMGLISLTRTLTALFLSSGLLLAFHPPPTSFQGVIEDVPLLIDDPSKFAIFLLAASYFDISLNDDL